MDNQNEIIKELVSVLLLIKQGMSIGKIDDCMILNTGKSGPTLEMQPLSEIIDSAISKAGGA